MNFIIILSLLSAHPCSADDFKKHNDYSVEKCSKKEHKFKHHHKRDDGPCDDDPPMGDGASASDTHDYADAVDDGTDLPGDDEPDEVMWTAPDTPTAVDSVTTEPDVPAPKPETPADNGFYDPPGVDLPPTPHDYGVVPPGSVQVSTPSTPSYIPTSGKGSVSTEDTSSSSSSGGCSMSALGGASFLYAIFLVGMAFIFFMRRNH